MRPPLPLRAIFAAPLALAAVGAVGLVGALTGDGWRDALAWAGLGAPVAAAAWAFTTRRNREARERGTAKGTIR